MTTPEARTDSATLTAGTTTAPTVPPTAQSTPTTAQNAGTDPESTATTIAVATPFLSFGEFCNPRDDACNRDDDLVCNSDSYKCLYITSTVTASTSPVGVGTTTLAAGAITTPPAADGSAGSAKSRGVGTVVAIVVILLLLAGVAGFVVVKQRRRARTRRKYGGEGAGDSTGRTTAYETSEGAIAMGTLAGDGAGGLPGTGKSSAQQHETSFGVETPVQTLDMDDFSVSRKHGDSAESGMRTFGQPTASSRESYTADSQDGYIETGSEGDGYMTTTNADNNELRRNTSAVSGVTLQEFGAEDELAC